MDNKSTDNRLICSGSKSEIYEEFEKIGFYNDDINKILSYISGNVNVLSAGESYKIEISSPSLPPGTIGFMTFNYNYHINLKYSTIFIIALILDINYTRGVSTFALGLLGIKNAEFKKISEYNGEKCIIKETICQKGKSGSESILEKFHGECCNNQYACKYKEIDKCNCNKKEITSIYESLCEKGVFKKCGYNYKYRL